MIWSALWPNNGSNVPLCVSAASRVARLLHRVGIFNGETPHTEPESACTILHESPVAARRNWSDTLPQNHVQHLVRQHFFNAFFEQDEVLNILQFLSRRRVFQPTLTCACHRVGNICQNCPGLVPLSPRRSMSDMHHAERLPHPLPHLFGT